MMTAETENPEPVSTEHGRQLTSLAVATVRARLLDAADTPVAVDPPLAEPGACFVTLQRDGRLRGCIGSLQAIRPLYQDVIHNATRAMRDPRLPPVDAQDWPQLDVSVSVLTAPVEFPVAGRAELLSALRPGIDGLLLTDSRRRATFLPTVWEKLTDPGQFLDQLLRKGGWPAGEWPADIRVSRYRSVEFTDRAPRGPLAVA